MAGIDKFRDFTVMVENGSGCLFQPMSDDYTYVLTAKHVIEDCNSINIVRKTIKDGQIICETLEVIDQPFINPVADKDAAIIKIKRVNNLDYLLRVDDVFENKDEYYLCGYPNTRADDNDGYRHNKTTAQHQKESGHIEVELEKFVTYDDVVGQSGGGILKFDSGYYLIAGIQKQMSVDDKLEKLSRIDFMPLSFFDEIIENNLDSLARLYPSFIDSFLNLHDKIFILHDLPAKKDLIRNFLHGLAKDLCKEFTPKKILDAYNDSFVIGDKSLVHCEYLWISFLELLVFKQIHTQDQLTLAELKNIHKKCKLFFGKSKRWTDLAEKIFKADLSEIEKGGHLIVAALGDPKPTMVTLSSQIVCDICNVPIKEMTIHSTIQNPFEDYTIKHIYVIQAHIINNCTSFLNANAVNIHDILKKETNGIL